MKSDWSHLEKYRMQLPPYESREGDHFGVFGIRQTDRLYLAIMATDGKEDGEGWEHVSVHGEEKHNGKFKPYTPSWEEMDMVKKLFWKDSELVVQFHVPVEDHVNNHPHTLHLWRNVNMGIKLPPKGFV